MTDLVDGFHGYGSTFKVGSGSSPETFTAVASIKRIKVPGLATADIDVAHLTSVDAFRKMIPGMKSAGKFGFTGNYRPANATHKNSGRGLLKLWKDRTIFNFMIVLSDADETEWECEGYVSALDPGEAGLDSVVEISGEITLTAEPTLP